MRITFRNLTKRFGTTIAVDDLSLEINDGEFVALLGPSGCGKTTTLLMVAGILRPSSGEILFDGRVVNDLEPRERNVGMVFQSYALYPHMTVFQNLAYPLRLKRMPRHEIEQRVKRIAELLHISNLLDRKPAQLSGGQQQRVALGRALVKEPQVLLFDEPLSNLDASLRVTMRAELKRLQRQLGITSIYVTHDQVEAMTMADRIAVMKGGRLEAFEPPDELYNRPNSLFVATFIGNPPMNLFEGWLERRPPVLGEDGPRRSEFRFRGADFELDLPETLARPALEHHERRPVVMGVRPEHIYVAGGSQGIPDEPAALAEMVAEVYVVEPMGRDHLLECRIAETPVRVLTRPELSRPPGSPVRLLVDTTRVHLFDPETGRSLLYDREHRPAMVSREASMS